MLVSLIPQVLEYVSNFFFSLVLDLKEGQLMVFVMNPVLLYAL